MDERRNRLAGTFQRFADEAKNRTTVMRGLVAGGLADGPASLQTLLLHAHTLAGSGETMGAAALGIAGAEIEALLRTLPPGTMPDPPTMNRLANLAELAAQEAERFDPTVALDRFLIRLAGG